VLLWTAGSELGRKLSGGRRGGWSGIAACGRRSRQLAGDADLLGGRSTGVTRRTDASHKPTLDQHRTALHLTTSHRAARQLDDWTETLELGGRIDVVYTDFEKAFDKVPRKRLLSKLKAYKLHSTIIEWIKNFF